MRKFNFFLTALLALFTTTAHADRILYSENYEAGGVPTTWKVNGGTGSIQGDQEGKYLSFALGQNNGRSAHCLWGENVYDEVKSDLAEYSVSIDFQFQAFGNNQFNGEFAVFSGENTAMINGSLDGKGKDWAAYGTRENCLFALTQNSATSGDDTDHTHWYINGDATDVITPTAGTWYNLKLTINTSTREVAYELADFDGTFSKKGSKTLTETENIYASGLYLMNARYQSVTNIDNIKVSVPGDYANKPVIALTGLNMEERTYTISFMEGETLHATLTDGSTKTIGYYDAGEVPGQLVVKTTTSGTLKAYTTAGTMTSEEVTTEVSCVAISLDGVVTYGIVAADEGFAKTYQFTIDNSGIEMNPEIFMDLSFKSEDGTKDFTKENQNNGAQITLPSKGTLTIITKALGYANGTTTIVNDVEYIVKYDIDFQHITGEQLLEKGFEKMDDLNHAYQSGENNWTARLRHYFQIATGEKDNEGNDIYTNYAVYGFDKTGKWGVKGSAETENQPMTDEKYAEIIAGSIDGRNYDMSVAEPIQRYQYLQSNLNEETAHSLFAPLYVWYGKEGIANGTTYFNEDGTPAVDHLGHTGGTTNVKFYPGIGLLYSGNIGDGGDFYTSESMTYAAIAINNVRLGLDGLTDDDLVVVSKIDNYGGGSVHPQFPAGTDPAAAKAEYLQSHIGAVNTTCKGTETFELYRVDTALNRVLVLAAKDASGIVELPYNKIVSDHNAPIFNLNGVQVNAKNLKKGVYVKQGKKFVVR